MPTAVVTASAAGAHLQARAPTTGGTREYERHRPETTILFETVQQHWTTFLAETQSGCDESPLPRFVVAEVEAYLPCGILAHGFVLARCNDCGVARPAAWSCQRRGFCPSCIGRRSPTVIQLRRYSAAAVTPRAAHQAAAPFVEADGWRLGRGEGIGALRGNRISGGQGGQYRRQITLRCHGSHRRSTLRSCRAVVYCGVGSNSIRWNSLTATMASDATVIRSRSGWSSSIWSA